MRLRFAAHRDKISLLLEAIADQKKSGLAVKVFRPSKHGPEGEEHETVAYLSSTPTSSGVHEFELEVREKIVWEVDGKQLSVPVGREVVDRVFDILGIFPGNSVRKRILTDEELVRLADYQARVLR